MEQRREKVIQETQKSLPPTNPRPTCSLHKTMVLEYYCESCSALICGQCMLDDHRIHGNVKYASDVLGSHVQELCELLPNADEAIVNGEDMLESLKSEIKRLNNDLGVGAANLGSYFQTLHKILQEREQSILNEMKAAANKKEKRLVKRIRALNQAVDSMKKSKMTLEDAVENRSNEVGILMEESRLKARMTASVKVVNDETLDCKSFIGFFSSIPIFIPDPEVESKCRSINYSVLSPSRRRSRTLVASSAADRETRQRANAIVPSERRTTDLSRVPLFAHESYPTELFQCHSPLTKMSRAVSAPAVKPLKSFTIPDPVSVVAAKSLVGPCNHVTAFPFGVCCMSQPEGVLLVTDAKHHLYRVITSTGKCLETIGCEGNGDGQFVEPVGVAVNPKDSSILVVDRKNPGSLQKFSNAGQTSTKLAQWNVTLRPPRK